MPRLHASIVVVGDEILRGFVPDTNSGWLARRLRLLGIPLERVVTVADDVEVIAAALGDELARQRPRVVLTSGGLGSTPDDLTVTGVARCLGVEVVRQPELDARIGRLLERHEPGSLARRREHAESLRKMALVPEGAYLVTDHDLAPGVAIDVDGGLDSPAGATVVVLPGVPALLRRITLEGVEPRLLAGRGQPDHVVELAHGYPESLITPALERVLREFATVHVGSYPGRECLVRLAGPRTDVEAAAQVVRAHLAELDTAPDAARLRDSWSRGWDPAGEGFDGET